MSQRPGQYPGMNNAHSYQQPQQKPEEPRFSSKQMLDAYIYDFLLKSSLKNTASTFCREAGIVDAAGEAQRPSILNQVKEAPQGFLYEWWQIFWDLFNARTHKEGSSIAREFSRILTDRQKQEYAYRSQAIQAARLQQMAGQHGERPRGPGEFSQTPVVNPNADYNSNSFQPHINSYSRGEPSSIPNQAPVSSHTPQFVPPYGGTNVPGWPVYPNQTSPRYPNSTVSNHIPSQPVNNNNVNQYHPNGPVPSSSPESVTSRNKQQTRPSSAKKKKHTLPETSASPEHSTMNYKGPVSSFSGKISGIEGLHNYQRQLIMSEIEYNNQNKKNSPSSSTNLGAPSKKHMLPPSAAISPHTIPSSSVSVPNMNLVNSSKPKVVRRRSANQILGPISKSMQASLSDSPCTPVNIGGPGSTGELNDKSIMSNPLESVAELSKPSSNGSHETSSKKGTKKVRKPKKPQSITFNNNNFNFISSNSVPTPPNESQHRVQYRPANKLQKKPISVRSNIKTIKSTAEVSPQLLVDDNSISTPTLINTVWNSNGKSQTTPHGNLTFVEDTSAHSASGTNFANVDSVAGSSSGASYQYSEADADDLLSINAILPVQEHAASKEEIPTTDVITGNQGETTAQESNNQEFNLDLLEPSEHSFNFLSWRQ